MFSGGLYELNARQRVQPSVHEGFFRRDCGAEKLKRKYCEMFEDVIHASLCACDALDGAPRLRCPYHPLAQSRHYQIFAKARDVPDC